MAEGIELEEGDRPCRPARLKIHEKNAEGIGEAPLTLRESRYHLLKRMIAAMGGHVVTLHRDQAGGLSVPESLAQGQCRQLTQEELEQIFS